jgi:SAM-dependent methyltransferase
VQRNTCRACNTPGPREVIDFGVQPLAGVFPVQPEIQMPAERFDLDLSQCDACGLLQVTNVPSIDQVFHDDYRYSSSTVPALVQHFEGYADWLTTHLTPGDRILEFGCNDGVLLSKLELRGFNGVGIDASDNVAKLGRLKGLTVHTGFMSEALLREKGLEKKFDLVTCSNVFAHIDDVRSTIAAVKTALKPGGLFSIEVHDASRLIERNQFDTIYHEHLTYFSEYTLHRLLGAFSFTLVESLKTPMHGGSLRMICRLAAHEESLSLPIDTAERIDGASIAEAVARSATDVRALYDAYGPLDGFGAAGRSQMFVNMTGTADCFGQVFDDSPLRQNRFIVGTDIPIRSFKGANGRACVILAWNYAESIIARIQDQYEAVVTILPERTIW